jgi:thiol-disulfide isomerase/thioredoxin
MASRRRLVVRALVISMGLTAVLTVGLIRVLNSFGEPMGPTVTAEPLPTNSLQSFDLPSLKSDAVRYSSKSFAGKPLVINVFDYTCVPCIRELPMISATASGHSEVAFLGVHLMLQRSDAQDFVNKLNLSFPVAYDGDGDLAGSIAALPTTIFLDSTGREVDRVNGPISKDDLAHRLERLKGGIS